MHILLNGKQKELADGALISDLVDMLALTGQRFAVEINAELVPRSRFALHPLNPGDQVEIIQAVGGG